MAETKTMCRASFERLLTAQLDQLKAYLEDLIVLTLSPFSNMPTKNPAIFTPKSIHASKEVERNTDMTAEMDTWMAEPTEPAMKDITNATSPGGLEAAILSSLRASSCSRENFASKLVKELYTNDDRLTCNIRGVLGKEKFNEKKVTYTGPDI